MKTIDTTKVLDPNKKQPFTANSLRFLQEGKEDDVAAIIKSIVTSNLGSYSLTVPYVISGCVVSDSNKDVTAGEIFYGGKYYETTAVNGTTNVAQFILTKSHDATADPMEFTNGDIENVHNIYKYVPTDTATAGDFDATDLVSLYGTKITQNLQLALLNTSSTSYATLTGLTYTTPNDGVTRKFMIVGNTSFNFSTSSGNGAFLQIWNGASELAVNENYLAIQTVNVDTAKLPISVCYVGSIAPNTTISLRSKMAVSASSNYLNNSLSIIEI